MNASSAPRGSCRGGVQKIVSAHRAATPGATRPTVPNAVRSAHNRAVDQLRSQGVPTSLQFAQARRLITWHYQWIIVNEFLPQIIGASLTQNILTQGRRWYRPDPGPAFIPVEFQGAAYRFGHSMVRPSYRLNLAGNPDGTPFLGFIFDPAGESYQVSLQVGAISDHVATSAYELSTISDEVAASSGEVAKAMALITRGAEGQSAGIRETSAALDELAAEAQVGLVRPEAALGLVPGHLRDLRRDLVPEHAGPDRPQHLLGDRADVGLRAERHLHVELGEFRLPVGP